MADDLARRKTQQRNEIRMRLQTMDAPQIASASTRIVELLRETLSDRLEHGVLAFHPLPDEPDLRPLLQQLLDEEHLTCLPGVDWRTKQMAPLRLESLEAIRTGKHGVVEPDPGCPVDCSDLTVVLVPGVGFDAEGRRLGRGGGFYDRFLADCPSHIQLVGVGFQQQLLERVETGPTDVPLPMVVTDAGVIEPGSSTMSAR